MAASKNTPKDAQVMAAILKEIGIVEYEPRVVNQMLEFTYRYVTNILDDALLFSTHANKTTIDIDDVRLAVKMQTEKYFTTPPFKEVLVEIAAQKNCTPLPLIKASAGPRLPPDRYNLTACNYRFKSNSRKSRGLLSGSRLNITSLQPASGNSKFSPQITLGSKSSGTMSIVTKAGTPSISGLQRPITNASVKKPFPVPIINFIDVHPQAPAPTTSHSISGSMPNSQIIMSPSVTKKDYPSLPEQGEKRKLKDMQEDYNVPM